MPIIGYKFYGRNIRPYLYAPEKKSHTILGMTLFSLIIFGAFAIRPSLVTISRLRQEVKKAHEAKTLLDQKIKDLSQAQVNYQLASGDIRIISQALPEDESIPSLLETLALAAGRDNVSLTETTFGSAPVCEGRRCGLPFTTTVSGELKDIENFITGLEQGPRQMDVQRVKINRGEESLVGEVELVAYFYE